MDVDGPTNRALSAFHDTLNAIKQRPHRQQIVMGVGSGLVAGYIFAKIGRVAALLLGGGLIALQCAVQQDVIRVDWRRMRQLRHDATSNGPWFSDTFSEDDPDYQPDGCVFKLQLLRRLRFMFLQLCSI
ncbi:FUN14 domain-containing protein 1 [Paragonimus westermani]|uniref:FUN14 domain-containing protein 1 n=1 Tax=Paragonimus westermani TaxID=34504 RepID=A0A5J4NND6_9TREM|nr:FUN14 domain-containing protein 1 [Paragonimus westermani]